MNARKQKKKLSIKFQLANFNKKSMPLKLFELYEQFMFHPFLIKPFFDKKNPFFFLKKTYFEL